MVHGARAEHNEGCIAELYDSDSDGEISTIKHTNLLDAVSQLDGKQRIKAPTRSEPSLQVTEFHLVGSGSSAKSKIHVTDLAKVLNKTSSHAEIGRKVKLVQKKSKTLPKPLEKNVSEKVRRSVAFENVKTELGKWEAVVHSNRSVDTLNFPLNQPDNRPLSSNAFIAKLKSQKPTELELKVAEILAESPCAQSDIKEDEEEEKEYAISLEELLEHRKEMAKMRALQSYKAAAAARQKRIKSKKYHRLQRREGVKKQIKNFELLQKNDPEAALKQLEELERVRVEERMTLRHRSTGQWARNKVIRAKYDKEARHALAEQLAVSRELTQKVGQEPDSGVDSDIETPEIPVEQAAADISSSNAENPWMVKTTSEVNQFVSGYRKFWEEQNKRKSETELAKNSNVNEETLENINCIERGKRMKLMENVVERVELLENANHSSSDEVELYKNDTDVLQEEKNMIDKCSKKSTEDKVVNEVGTREKKVRELIESKKQHQSIHHENLNVKRKKQKSNVGREEQRKQTRSSLTSTSVSWIVTEVNASGSKRQSEGKKRENKIRRKKIIGLRVIDSAKPKITSHLEIGTNMEIDDLFDEAEENLKQKIKDKVNTLQSSLKDGAKHEEEPNDIVSDSKINVDGPSLVLKKRVTRPVVDEELGEVAHENSDSGQVDVIQNDSGELALLSQSRRDSMQQSTAPSTVSIDPNVFLQVKQKYLMSQIPDVVTKGDEVIDDDEEEGENENEGEREKLIAEAFADDDVVAEFRDEKEDLIEKSKPKDIDLTLPGWGDWGGPNISVSKRKKRRFIIKVPKDAPRRDDNKGNLIINEDKDTKIKQHQVNELPFPFERVQDFEASIRAPVGRDWVPETAHRKMILPAVRTKLGTVIEPMDEDVLFRKKKKIGQKKKYFPI